MIIHDTEINDMRMLLDEVYERYGYDFRDYSEACIHRRVRRFMTKEGLSEVSELRDRVSRRYDCMERLLSTVSVTVTDMFRDPGFYRAIRETVVPYLRTHPFIRIWDAGCASGQEAYSLAIMMQEEQLYDRCRIYATDIDETSLKIAKSGIYPLAAMPSYARNYLQSGGQNSFGQYYSAENGQSIIQPALKRNIVFAHHNLVTDRSFNDFQLIVCRNVLIYFNKPLQNRVHDLFFQSLLRFGMLALGSQESIRFSPKETCYEVLQPEEKLYRRVR